jgi:enoyl reductase-like protein
MILTLPDALESLFISGVPGSPHTVRGTVDTVETRPPTLLAGKTPGALDLGLMAAVARRAELAEAGGSQLPSNHSGPHADLHTG